MDRWRQLRKHLFWLDAVSNPALTHCSKRQSQVALEQRDCFESLVRIQELREIQHDAQDLSANFITLVPRTGAGRRGRLGGRRVVAGTDSTLDLAGVGVQQLLEIFGVEHAGDLIGEHLRHQADGRVVLLPDQLHHLAHAVGPLVGVGFLKFFVERGADQVLEHRPCRFQYAQHSLGALGAYQLVRIHLVRQLPDLRRDAGEAARLTRSLHRASTRGVSVEEQRDVLGEAADRTRLLFGERGTERRDHLLDAARMQTHHVEIAFDHHAALATAQRLTGLVQAEHRFALPIDRRLGRVDVLGGRFGTGLRGRLDAEFGKLTRLRLCQRATTERDHAALQIQHREHQAVPEAIVIPAARLARHDDADLLGCAGAEPRRRQVPRQAVPTVRRIADAERLQRISDRTSWRVRGKPSAIELCQTMAAERVLAQHQLEVMRGSVADVIELLLPAASFRLLPALRLGARLDDLNSGALGEFTHGLGELEALDALHELDGIARLVAAEAVIEAALGVDVEAGCLLLVERTHADMTAAALLQPDGLPDQLYDPNLPPHAVEGLLSDHETHILQIEDEERPRAQGRYVFVTLFPSKFRPCWH